METREILLKADRVTVTFERVDGGKTRASTTSWGDARIEFYGPVIRIGLEGKWVEWIARPEGPKPKRKKLLALIRQMDQERTH